jgi:hypothetical protein
MQETEKGRLCWCQRRSQAFPVSPALINFDYFLERLEEWRPVGHGTHVYNVY